MHALILVNVNLAVQLTWLLLGVLAVLGGLALISPQRFAKLSSAGSRWFDSSKLLAVLDKRFDIDQYILPFSRVLGALVLASVTVLALLLQRI